MQTLKMKQNLQVQWEMRKQNLLTCEKGREIFHFSTLFLYILLDSYENHSNTVDINNYLTNDSIKKPIA